MKVKKKNLCQASVAFRLFGCCKSTIIFRFIKAWAVPLAWSTIINGFSIAHVNFTPLITETKIEQRVEVARAREKTYQINYAWRSMGDFANKLLFKQLVFIVSIFDGVNRFDRYRKTLIYACDNKKRLSRFRREVTVAVATLKLNRFIVQPLHRL